MAKFARTRIDPDVTLPTRRSIPEWVIVRWPRLQVALSRQILKLPPRSRLRRAAVRWGALSGWGAWVRGDLDLCVVRFAPDYRYDPPKQWLLPGMPTVYHGHTGLRQWAADLHEAWEFLDHTPLELVDMRDRFAFLCRTRLRARTSGIEVESHLGQVFWLEQGLIVRERDFGDWDEALRELGLPVEAAGRHPEPYRLTSPSR